MLIWTAVTLWALNAVVAKVVLDSAGVSAFRLAEVRATGSALILVTVVLILNPASMRIGRRELVKLAVFGVLGLGVVQLFYFVGIRRLDIGIALVINYLAPVFVALWARFYVHEPVRRRLWLAIALSLFGLTLVVELGAAPPSTGWASPRAWSRRSRTRPTSSWRSNRSPAAETSTRCSPGASSSPRSSGRSSSRGGAFRWRRSTAASRCSGGSTTSASPVWLLLAYIVILGTVVPFVMLVSALHHVPATRVTIVAMLEPVLAALVAWVWLGEELAAIQILGGLLVLAGVVLDQTARPDPRNE